MKVGALTGQYPLCDIKTAGHLPAAQLPVRSQTSHDQGDARKVRLTSNETLRTRNGHKS